MWPEITLGMTLGGGSLQIKTCPAEIAEETLKETHRNETDQTWLKHT